MNIDHSSTRSEVVSTPACSRLPVQAEKDSPLNTSFSPEKPMEIPPAADAPQSPEKAGFSPVSYMRDRWNQFSAGDKASVAVFATLATVEACFFLARLGGLTAPFHAGLLAMDLMLLTYHFAKPLSRNSQ